ADAVLSAMLKSGAMGYSTARGGGGDAISVIRSPALSSMITTSPRASRTPLTVSWRSSPADCPSSTRLLRSSARHCRTVIVPVPSITLVGQTTSSSCWNARAGEAVGLELDNEFVEEDVDNLCLREDLRGGAEDALLQRGLAFRRHKIRGLLRRQQLEDGRANAGLGHVVFGEMLGVFLVRHDQSQGRAQKARR